MNNGVGDEIRKGFNALAGGVKEAGRKRIMDLVQKDGYVAFRNPVAIEQFKNDPEYANWEYINVDGEYRFYPVKDLLPEYKEVRKNKRVSTTIAIKFLNDGSGKCEYKLIVKDKKSGVEETKCVAIADVNDKFMLETLPSLYYHLCGGMPVVDYEKNGDSYTNYNLISLSGEHMMLIGNLDKEQLAHIKNMKLFVDEKLNLNIPVGRHQK